jgi:Fe-S-cluster containining protein
VELADTDEASALEVLGLDIEEDDDGSGLLLQPCRALKGKCCSIYPHRPDCCRTFECRLLHEVKRGTTGVDQAKSKIAEALQQIGHVKELLVRLGPGVGRLPLKERYAEAMASAAEAKTEQETKRTYNQLKAAMTGVERLIQETFLSASGRL